MPSDNTRIAGRYSGRVIGQPVRDESSGTTYEPWTDGWAIGYKVTRGTETSYIYLNPCDSDDGVPTVFVYMGPSGIPGNDGAVHHYVIESALPDLISGDWLMTHDDQRYRWAFACKITGQWSGGYNAKVTAQAMGMLITVNNTMRREVPDTDYLAFLDDGNVLHTSPSDPSFLRVIQPDKDGLYEVPSWTWNPVDASKCDRIFR